jgi:hypothetical protein
VHEQELATPAARVAARAAAVQRGESRSGQRGVGESGGEVGEGTWKGLERRWGGRDIAHGWQSSGGAQAERTEEEGERGRRKRTGLKFSERTGTPL